MYKISGHFDQFNSFYRPKSKNFVLVCKLLLWRHNDLKFCKNILTVLDIVQMNFSCYNIKRLIDAIKGVVRLYHNSTMAWTTNQLLFHLAGMVYYCLINIHYIESRIHIADCFSGKNLVTFWPVTKMGRGLQILVTKSEKGEGSSNSSNFFGGEVDDVR